MSTFEKLKSWRVAVLVVAVPMLVAIAYYAFFASNRYVSTAQVIVRQVGERQSSPSVAASGLAMMLGGINPTSREETLFLREFLTSQDMLAVLQKQLNWSQHYAGRWQDPLYWLPAEASEEDVLGFYRRLVTAHFDEQTGLLEVEVQAFDRDFSQQVLRLMLGEAERFVNEISHKMARDQMAFAQGELANARKEYERRRDDLLVFQSQSNMLNAEASAKAQAEVIADLEATLTKERTALTGLMATLAPNTPQIRQQRVRIQALEQQLAVENKRLVSRKSGEKLNVVASQYRNLTIDAGIAEDAYKAAVGGVETARMEASKKLRSLVTVVSPNRPDEAVYPQRAYNLITLFIVLLLLYGIVRFVISTIEDHRD
ncbi:MPA2 family protein involved in capsular polysaccharide export [Bordetella ansorpii]|uniref:MPA2 family protein involved in capsular polysaccharide export n=1 Tax=Bordetella ansorpii TaxID=288768 RepID=A0A157SWV7_9BORD|nr:ABC transporter permease [Bordetella ansorpii]SAI74821.1 MPA2 family protein involved in capsular polysaccharide export [Bordetella ansorpii]